MKKLFYAINTLAATGLIFAYISPYVKPSITWFFSFFGLGYPFLLVTNILFVFFWLAIKPKYALTSGLIIALGFIPLQKAIGFNKKSKETGITLMTYNIGKTRLDFHNNKKRAKKIKRFKAFIKEEQPDIICIQERFPKHFEYYKKIFTDYNLYPNLNIGTAIYTKYPIVKGGNIPFNTMSHNGTWADLNIKGKIFRIYSIHLSSNHVNNLTDNYKDIIDESKYILSKYNQHAIIRAGQLKQILAHAAKSPHPVIISGDFNDVPQSYIYSMIDKDYTDAFRVAGRGLMQTYISRFIGLRIDFTFTSPNIEIYDHDIIKTNLSDHYPVVTTINPITLEL